MRVLVMCIIIGNLIGLNIVVYQELRQLRNRVTYVSKWTVDVDKDVADINKRLKVIERDW